MIIKTLSRKSGTGNIINYLFKDEKKQVNENDKPLVIRHNIRARKTENVINEFKANEQYRLHRRNDSVEAYHTILSFSAKDKEHITKDVLKDITKKYIELRGKDSLYIGTAHKDREHVHIHLVEGGVKYMTGKANRISKAQFKELKLSMDAYQKEKYPELVHSLPRHGLKAEKGKEKGVLDTKATQKESLLQSLEMAYGKALSLDTFLSACKAEGHTPYYRGEKLTGIELDSGRKFRFETLGFETEGLAKLEANQAEEDKDLEDLRSIRSESSERNMDDRGRSLDDDEEDEEDEDEEDDDPPD